MKEVICKVCRKNLGTANQKAVDDHLKTNPTHKEYEEFEV